MKKHMPVNFLTNGNTIKGFNDIGELVAIYDNYNNIISIEYEQICGKNRINCIYDGENNEINLNYFKSNLLSSITNARGKKTKYSYHDDSIKLKKVTFANGKRVTFEYDANNNINFITSSDKMKTSLTYNENSALIGIVENSLVSFISATTVTDSTVASIIELARYSIEYAQTLTKIITLSLM